MKKRTKRSPREIIESRKSPSFEEVYVKFPGEELVPMGVKAGAWWDTSRLDLKKLKNYLNKLPRNKQKRGFTEVHTHPHYAPPGWSAESDTVRGRDIKTKYFAEAATPSNTDIKNFLRSDDIKTMVIAPQQTQTGKIGGYLVLRKTKKTKRSGFKITKPSIFSELPKLPYRELRELGIDLYMKGGRSIEDIARKYNLQYRFVGAGAEKERNGVRGKYKTLEKTLAITSIFVLILSTPLLSQNLTGYTILNANNSLSYNLLTLSLVVILIGAWIWFKKQHKQQQKKKVKNRK